MAPTPVSEFTTAQVCQWLVAIGLGSQQQVIQNFQSNGVDGKLLLELTANDLTSDLGLSNIQAKKVLLELDFMKELGSSSSAEGNPDAQAKISELMGVIDVLQAQNEALERQVQELTTAHQQSAAAPATQQQKAAPSQSHHTAGAPVIRGAGRGAARGALLGAVGGAIAGDAGKGAKIGAAVGGTRGGLQGIGQRRRAGHGLLR